VEGSVGRRLGGLLVAAAALVPLIPDHPGTLCPLRALTGIPCPLCGMTTSVTATVRLDFAEAWTATPAGIVAIVTAAALLVFRPKRIRLPVAGVLVSLAAMWVYQLFRFSVL
jgi:hypothetical protein